MGYKVNCSDDWKEGCTIFMTPFEPTYQTFLGYLKDKTLELGFTLSSDSDIFDINMVNERIRKEVSSDTKNRFGKDLGTFNPRYPIEVKLVLDLSKINANTYPKRR